MKGIIQTICVFAWLVANLARAQEGELRGKITDSNSGQPLAGVTITLEGFERQAVTDESGEFVLLGVWPGRYVTRCTSAENETFVIEALRIHAFTTTHLEVQWAERAATSKYADKLSERAGTVQRIEQNYIHNTPVRGLENLLKLQSGVIEQNGELYIRGGAANDLSSFINGVNATNLLSNNSAMTLEAVPEAIEEIQLRSGAFSAEFHDYNAALVHTVLRSGGEEFHATLDYRTDDFAEPGAQFLNTSSFGYRNAVATVGGPLGKHVRYFIAGQHNYLRNRTISFVEPFRFENLTEDGLGGRAAGVPLPDALGFERNYLPHNWLQNNTVQGNLLFTKAAFNLRFTGAYAHDNRPLGADTFSGSLSNYFNLARGPESTTKTGLFSLRATHALSAKSFYAINLSYSQQSFTNADPAFGNDWMSYGDSAKVTPLGYSDWRQRYIGPAPHSVILYFTIAARGAPINNFQKGRQSNLGVAADFTTLLQLNWKIKTGLRFDRWSLRDYRVADIRGALVFLNGQDGKTPRQFPSPEQRALELAQRGVIYHLGYDVDGNEVGAGADGPRTPHLLSLYAQSEYQLQPVLFNLGLRYERIASKAIVLTLVDDPLFNQYYEESEAKPTDHFLPRFGFTLPFGEQTTVHGSFGKYVAPAEVLTLASRSVRLGSYVFIQGADPLMQTKYELGVRHTVADYLKANVSYFSRRDEIFDEAHGLELDMKLQPIPRLRGGLRYTWTDYPENNSISEASIAHRGVLQFDYRLAKNEGGKILQGMGLLAVFSATSGHEYTAISNGRNLPETARTPWNFQVDLGLNKIFALRGLELEFYIHALNLLNKKNIINVYPITGEPDDDGWLSNPLAEQYKQIPNYEAFYRAINLDNRWAYTLATGHDIYGQPRQLRLGVRAKL